MERDIEQLSSGIGTTDANLQILTWTIGTQLFGMDISECKEVVRNRQVTIVPYAPDNISGIVNLRGEVVTVLDLRKLLGYGKDTVIRESVIICLKSAHSNVAIKADTISDVIEITKDRLESPPAHLNEMETRFIRGVVLTDKGLVVILNPNEIVKQ